MSRYVIVSLLPPHPDQALRAWYHSLTGRPIPIQLLHLTLVPTFFLGSNRQLNNIISAINNTKYKILDTKFSFSPPAFFTGPDKKLILHLPVIPEKPLSDLSDHLIRRLRPSVASGEGGFTDLIHFDLSIYTDHKLPPYQPHISLDYDFPKDLQEKTLSTPLPQNLTFTLNQPVILQEHPDLSWKII